MGTSIYDKIIIKAQNVVWWLKPEMVVSKLGWSKNIDPNLQNVTFKKDLKNRFDKDKNVRDL